MEKCLLYILFHQQTIEELIVIGDRAKLRRNCFMACCNTKVYWWDVKDVFFSAKGEYQAKQKHAFFYVSPIEVWCCLELNILLYFIWRSFANISSSVLLSVLLRSSSHCIFLSLSPHNDMVTIQRFLFVLCLVTDVNTEQSKYSPGDAIRQFHGISS